MKFFGKELMFNGNKVYHAGNKPTASEIGAAASSHSHNYAGSSSAGGVANSATVLATARTINGTSFNGSANITTANWGTARNITIGNTTKSVNGSGNVAWTLSEIGAADASKLLPLTGGTLTGRLTASGKISMPTTSGSWITGKTLTNAAIAITTTQTSGSYHPILAVKSNAGHVMNLGGINNEYGFYGYEASRTENGTDWYFKFNAANGDVNHSGTMQSSRFISHVGGQAAFLEKWFKGGKTARIDYYQNPNRLELFWSATVDATDWTWANTIYFDENGTVKARTFNVNGCKMAYDTSSPNNVQFIRPDGAEYAQVTCRSLNIGAYSGVTRKLSIETSAPSSPKSGDVWIQV